MNDQSNHATEMSEYQHPNYRRQYGNKYFYWQTRYRPSGENSRKSSTNDLLADYYYGQQDKKLAYKFGNHPPYVGHEKYPPYAPNSGITTDIGEQSASIRGHNDYFHEHNDKYFRKFE